MTWYDGENQPAFPPETKLPRWKMGVLFVGAHGLILADYDRRILYPETQFRDYEPPAPSLPASIGHHAEWIAACKTDSATTCNFDDSGALTEAVLLGNVAYRVGKKLDWDAGALRARDCPDAETYLKRAYRKGWSL